MNLLLICEEGLNSTILTQTLATIADNLHVEYTLSAYYWGSDFVEPDIAVIMFSVRLMREHFVLKDMGVVPELSDVPVVAMAMHPEQEDLNEIIQGYGVRQVHVFPFSLRDLATDIEASCL